MLKSISLPGIDYPSRYLKSAMKEGAVIINTARGELSICARGTTECSCASVERIHPL
jgi:hypothetical protein